MAKPKIQPNEIRMLSLILIGFGIWCVVIGAEIMWHAWVK